MWLRVLSSVPLWDALGQCHPLPWESQLMFVGREGALASIQNNSEGQGDQCDWLSLRCDWMTEWHYNSAKSCFCRPHQYYSWLSTLPIKHVTKKPQSVRIRFQWIDLRQWFISKYPLCLRDSGYGNKLQVIKWLKLTYLHFRENIFSKPYQNFLERRGSQICLLNNFNP